MPRLRQASSINIRRTAAGFPMRGGSAEPLLVYGCLRQMTENRTEELWELVNY